VLPRRPKLNALVVPGFKNTAKLLKLIQSPAVRTRPLDEIMLVIKVALLEIPFGVVVPAI
jgi:hypothetical protein